VASTNCSVPDCTRLHTGKGGDGYGMCGMHYQRWKRHGDVNHTRPRGVCAIDGCQDRIKGRGWCTKHYKRWVNHGDPLARLVGEVRDGKKVCGTCGEDKPLAEYSRLRDPCRPCVAAAVRARRAVKPTYVPVVRQEKACGHCGATFQADKRRHTFCSTPCLQAAWRAITLPASVHARRTRIADPAEAEKFSRTAVFDADGWVCQLCDHPVNPALRYPHPGSVSLDHIIPLSRGGAHRRDNAQTAHLQCNRQKGATLAEGVAV
jgi:RNA polymerase subunit RPABC4/transcription elongation factor Spt4